LSAAASGSNPLGWKPEYPFAAILVLESDSTRGLDHELVDLRPGRKRRAITTGLSAGDVALVCAHRRVVRIAGVDGLQEIAHAFSARSGTLALLVPLALVA